MSTKIVFVDNWEENEFRLISSPFQLDKQKHKYQH